MAAVPYDTDRVWTLPNVLSLVRLAGVPLFLWLVLVPHADLWAVGVLMVASATDWLDGFLARRWHQVSRIGQMLDPVADRLYIVATLVGLGLRGIVPWWLVALLVARDLMMVSLLPALRSRGCTTLPVHYLGKMATFCLLYAFPLVLLGATDWPLATACTVLGWASVMWGTGLYWWAGLLYVRQTVDLVTRPEPTTDLQPPGLSGPDPAAAGPGPAGAGPPAERVP